MGGGTHSGRVSYAGGHGSHNARISDFGSTSSLDDKKRVFVSHSMRDHAQAELLQHHLTSEKYDIQFIDTSLQNPVVNRSWKVPVGHKIENSDAVICLIGEDTYSRPAVSWEINTAYRHGVPVIPVRVHRDQRDRVPKPIRREGDEVINWNLDDIETEVNYAS